MFSIFTPIQDILKDNTVYRSNICIKSVTGFLLKFPALGFLFSLTYQYENWTEYIGHLAVFAVFLSLFFFQANTNAEKMTE